MIGTNHDHFIIHSQDAYPLRYVSMALKIGENKFEAAKKD